MLYAVQMLIPDYVNPVKVGVAVDAKRRLASYGMGPFPVTCLGVWRGTRKDEQKIHIQFAEHRLTGEWFYPAEELLLMIQHETGMIRISRTPRGPEESRLRRMVRPFVGTPNEGASNKLLRKARDVLGRHNTPYLSHTQLSELLGMHPQALDELRDVGDINCETHYQYRLDDLVAYLRKRMYRHAH